MGAQQNFVNGTTENYLGEGEIEAGFSKMALEFLSCVQSALLSAGYDNIILKVKQILCMESIYLKKDIVAVLPTGYGKSLVFHVLPGLLASRDARSTSSSDKSVILVVSPLNALIYDQIKKLRERGVQAAILGVKKLLNQDVTDDTAPLQSLWDGTRAKIIQAEYEIVFCHPESFLSCKDGLEVLQSDVYLSAVKAVIVDEAHCILEW